MLIQHQLWLNHQIIKLLIEEMKGQVIERMSTFIHHQSKQVPMHTMRITVKTLHGDLVLTPYGSWIDGRFTDQDQHIGKKWQQRYEGWNPQKAFKDFKKKIVTLIPRHIQMTDKQREIWEFIRKYNDDNGFPPSQREIGHEFLLSPHAVTCHLNLLERKGVINRNRGQNRGLTVVDEELPDTETGYDKLVEVNKRLKAEVAELKAQLNKFTSASEGR